MRCKKENGFTLLEIIIVGIIISVLTAITLPRMGFLFSTNKLRSSTSSVTSYLYLARNKAVNDGEDIGVQFYVDGTIEIVRDPFDTLEKIGSANRIENGITFDEITFVDWLAIFNSFGQLDKACLPEGDLIGTVFLNNDKGDTTRVDITMVTGRIRETNL